MKKLTPSFYTDRPMLFYSLLFWVYQKTRKIRQFPLHKHIIPYLVISMIFIYNVFEFVIIFYFFQNSMFSKFVMQILIKRF